MKLSLVIIYNELSLTLN